MLLHKAESCTSVYVIVLVFSIWFERREAKEGGQQVGMESRTEPLTRPFSKDRSTLIFDYVNSTDTELSLLFLLATVRLINNNYMYDT